jgi:hypothetical protein
VPGIKNKDIDIISEANGINLAKLAIQYANGVILGDENIEKEILDHVTKMNLPLLPFTEITHPDSAYIQNYNDFYEQILNKK